MINRWDLQVIMASFNFNQRQMASYLNIDSSYLSRIISGERPFPDKLKREIITRFELDKNVEALKAIKLLGERLKQLQN